MTTKTSTPTPRPASCWYVARIVDGAVVVGRCCDRAHAERRTEYLTRQGMNPRTVRATSKDLALAKAAHLYAAPKGI